MSSVPDKIREILKEYGTACDDDQGLDDLVVALDEYNDECGQERYEAGLSDGEANEQELREEIEDEIQSRVMADLKTYLDLAKSDPQSAAVYFHRATGKHLFEVQQPCLL